MFLFWPCIYFRISGQDWACYCVSCHGFYSTRGLVCFEKTEGLFQQLLIFLSIFYIFRMSTVHCDINVLQKLWKLNLQLNYVIGFVKALISFILVVFAMSKWAWSGICYIQVLKLSKFLPFAEQSVGGIEFRNSWMLTASK